MDGGERPPAISFFVQLVNFSMFKCRNEIYSDGSKCIVHLEKWFYHLIWRSWIVETWGCNVILMTFSFSFTWSFRWNPRGWFTGRGSSFFSHQSSFFCGIPVSRFSFCILSVIFLFTSLSLWDVSSSLKSHFRLSPSYRHHQDACIRG